MTYDKESFMKGLITGMRLGRPKPRYGPKIVTWADGTDAEIAAMVAALDAGTITIADTGWQIGDERVVSWDLSLVLMDSQHYELATPTSGGKIKDSFVVGAKDGFDVGIMQNGRSNEGSWEQSIGREWCNGTFRNRIPSVLRGCFKQFRTLSAAEYDSSYIATTTDYFALFAEKEVFGECTYSNQAEANAISQIAYYVNPARRKKDCRVWWLRSCVSDNQWQFCMIAIDQPYYMYSDANCYYVPFGCI